MFKLKRAKNQKGFTLVEVIVVAVIVAALAAVAVPLYLGYVESSRRNAASNTAGAIASFCGACVNSGGETTPASGAAVGTVTCNNDTRISVPSDIIVTLVAAAPAADGNPATSRGVQARHTASADEAANIVTFNY